MYVLSKPHTKAKQTSHENNVRDGGSERRDQWWHMSCILYLCPGPTTSWPPRSLRERKMRKLEKKIGQNWAEQNLSYPSRLCLFFPQKIRELQPFVSNNCFTNTTNGDYVLISHFRNFWSMRPTHSDHFFHELSVVYLSFRPSLLFKIERYMTSFHLWPSGSLTTIVLYLIFIFFQASSWCTLARDSTFLRCFHYACDISQ